MSDLLSMVFTADFLGSVIRMSTPILFVALAALVGRKADVLCIAYEGIMLFAAFGGVVGSAYTGTVTGGLLLGILLGMFLIGIFAYFVLYLHTRPLLIGLALNILGSAGTVFGLYILTGSKANSTRLGSLTFPEVHIPLIKDITVLGTVLSGHNVLTYVAFLSIIIVQIFIYRTGLGLRIRSVGESPEAASSLGIDVNKTKFIALLISGVLASMGGIFLSMAYLPYFTRDMTAGRGFIGIAAESLGGGKPLLTGIWILIFGAADAVGNLTQSFRLPSQFAQMAPYLTTLIGLVLISVVRERKKVNR